MTYFSFTELLCSRDCETLRDRFSYQHMENVLSLPSKYSNKAKSMNIQYALAIACNRSIISIASPGELIVYSGTVSKLEKMKLHRSKCACLIKNDTSCFT